LDRSHRASFPRSDREIIGIKHKAMGEERRDGESGMFVFIYLGMLMTSTTMLSTETAKREPPQIL
jgi:hypothetical protein